MSKHIDCWHFLGNEHILNAIDYSFNELSLYGIRWQNLKNVGKGGSPVLVVMGGDSFTEGRWFEFRHSILDGHFSHIFVVKIVIMFVWKDRK